MSIKIRLARAGSKKRPFYRVVAADSRMPRDGRFIEKLGTYNPLLKKDDNNRVNLDLDRIKEWLSKGAQTTDRISRLLENLEVVPGRLQFIGRSSSGAPIYVDFAHTPQALASILKTLRPYTKGSLSLVFGCGGERDSMFVSV